MVYISNNIILDTLRKNNGFFGCKHFYIKYIKILKTFIIKVGTTENLRSYSKIHSKY